MADKKKIKKKKDVEEGPFYPKDKPPKPMTEIAKWMKKNVPTKKTKFLYHQVNYFIGSKAVDALMETKWAKPKKEGETPLFSDRTAVTEYLDLMLRYKFFHRAKKIAVSDAKKKKKDEKKDEKKEDKKEKKKVKSEKSETEEEEKKAEEAESSQGEGKEKEGDKKDDKGKGDAKGKEKRKIRLDMHLEQIFLDSSDAYVWIYDPIPLWYWAAGTLVVIATVGLCLFPLWPPTLRKGVYYLSIAAAGFLLFILGLAVLRFILFCLVWAVSLGKHHFWLLPNLTEDVGFFASFWPLYQYEYKGKGKSKQKKKKKKAKDSDAEEENEDAPQEEVTTKEEKSESKVVGSEVQEVQDERLKGDGDKSETESEGSQKSQVGKDFEIVEKEEGSE